MKISGKTWLIKVAVCLLLVVSACALAGCSNHGGSNVASDGRDDDDDSDREKKADAGNSLDAVSMWLVKTEGDVSVTDGDGENVPLIERLGLDNGYGVDTHGASFGWIDLDDAKLVKMDEDSGISVWKKGKKLKMTVTRGSLFFRVSEPLDDDAPFEIRTSDMATSIRGTCGWVSVLDPQHMNVYVLEGVVECSAEGSGSDYGAGQGAGFGGGYGTGPGAGYGTGAVQTVSAGHFASMDAETSSITVNNFSAWDVPAFVKDEIAQDDDLCALILEASGLNLMDGTAKRLTEPLDYETHTSTRDVGNPVVDVHYDGLTVYGPGEGIKKINEYLAQLEQNFLESSSIDTLLEYASDPREGVTYFYEGGLTVSYNDKGILSVVEHSEFYGGGPHGWPEDEGYTFDVVSGERLYLSDVTDGADQEITQMVVSALHDDYGYYNVLDWDKVESYNPKDFRFYLTDTGVVVYFNPEEIGPYMAGSPTVILPLNIHS